MSTIIRISDEAKAKIAALAKDTDRPMTVVVDDALDALERKLFFDSLRRRYAELRADPVAWAEIEAERRLEENTLADGLD